MSASQRGRRIGTGIGIVAALAIFGSIVGDGEEDTTPPAPTTTTVTTETETVTPTTEPTPTTPAPTTVDDEPVEDVHLDPDVGDGRESRFCRGKWWC